LHGKRSISIPDFEAESAFLQIALHTGEGAGGIAVQKQAWKRIEGPTGEVVPCGVTDLRQAGRVDCIQ
jgi:hypothetical protein